VTAEKEILANNVETGVEREIESGGAEDHLRRTAKPAQVAGRSAC
jgi:hypothetical protein